MRHDIADDELVNELVEELETICKSFDDDEYMIILLARGLINCSHNRLQKKMTGVQQLTEFLERQEVPDTRTLLALIKLIELKLDEYILYQDREVYEEILDLLVDLDGYKSPRNQIQINIITSKLKIIEEKYQEGLDILKNTLVQTKEAGIEELTTVIEDEIEDVHSLIDKWNNQLKSNKSLVRKMQDNRIRDYIKRAKFIVGEDE